MDGLISGLFVSIQVTGAVKPGLGAQRRPARV
jgi:hypothetical protein